eukprot:CAMPEP_0201695040 /NCGR_PEP_ID=MMETSP0578-20130828/7108_1 /ASSEMBLY_ACC=CAM_ASM_000663 /TAXON_ID=267565 /ORGANISM="Skeletonema grethea, Strain CCMP 1804" /LENGTH=484 /DNA_ID=CAMNT_0048180815 /DNA_START=159 /DNA_END=1613 /DNA_ORIENTATION=+
MMMPSHSAGHITFLLSAMLLLPATSFLQPQAHSLISKISTEHNQQQHCYYMTTNDEDEDDYIDEDSLGDWRSFRMNLANSAASSTSTSSSTIDGIDLLEESSKKTTTTTSEDVPSSSSTRAESRPKSVSKQNELLLSAQNSALAEEYINGVWAHESSIPEVGGLVCRMPLESEIYRGSPDSFMYNKLQTFLESDEYGTEDVTTRNTNNNGQRSLRSSTTSQSMSFSALAAKTVFWYRGAEKLLKQEMVKIMSTANTNGRIDPSELDEESLELLQLYMDHQSTWQEVCLVTSNNGGGSKTITINRPMAFKLSKSMARLVLMGAYQAGESDSVAVTRKEKDGQETQNLVKFLSAFENQCAVYVGGPDDMDKPAVLVHGIEDLPGAVEISRGTGIYQGGLEAAIDGVLSGKYKPLDFRFFVGHTRYTKGQLEDAVTKGKYQPIACSRPLVLKQCIQLPKPLWHEVLEFCGGELKEISKLELSKREDL